MTYHFHVLSLPWAETTADPLFAACAYTARVCDMAQMMHDRGHHVTLYGGERNDTPCSEYVTTVTRDDVGDLLGTTNAPWDTTHPLWQAYNGRAAEQIAKRAKPRDFLLMPSSAHWSVAQGNPVVTPVEFSIGYAFSEAPFRVYESQTWRATCYGRWMGTDYDGPEYHTVIPRSWDPADFYVQTPDPDPYFLFIGRGIARKRPEIAAAVAEHLGVRLILAGHDLGAFPAYGERVGVVDHVERARLMAGAAAVFVPTLYGGPFEGVAVEALLSGCPVITSDHGVFTEYVHEGDGWRCNTMAEYVDAGRMALTEAAHGGYVPDYEGEERWGRPIDVRHERRRRAIVRFSHDVVAPQYERYFGRLMELWDGPGWGALEHPVGPSTG